jgi:peptidoglycan L-alanyl-D-glutamate endopeptidase CwlK
MPSFGTTSKERLETCHPLIQRVAWGVVAFHDCTVLEGHRVQDKQHEYFVNGTSKVDWPDGKHNTSPSEAIDIAPYFASRGGVVWPDKKNRPQEYTKDLAQFYYFAGIFIDTARHLDVGIRWGGDWDRDHDLLDQRFDDLVHFELRLP